MYSIRRTVTVPLIYIVSKISVDSVDSLENKVKEGYLANPICNKITGIFNSMTEVYCTGTYVYQI
jgi:hypothetical protein